MDQWRYFEVTHARHGIMNPISAARLLEVGEVLGLDATTRVLDIACGHAEMLMLWHERFGSTGVGIDASPYHIGRAWERKAARLPDADLDLRHADGQEFATNERFDVVACLGATWIWDGFAGTLRALAAFAKPGGIVVCGEPYWIAEPTADYLRHEDVTRATFHDLDGCRKIGIEDGRELIWMAGSTTEEWDRYELLQAAGLDDLARERPDDPDLPALRERRRAADAAYFSCGRRCLGFAVWAFRLPR